MNTNKKLTRMQTHSVISRILAVCRKTDGGVAVYTDGHDDHTIAEEFNISNYQVASCRLEAIGPINTKSAGKTATKVRLNEMEQRLSALEAKFASWESGAWEGSEESD